MIKTLTPESLAALEKSLLTISDMLRCTTAAAYESGEAREGEERDLPFAVVHMLGAMKAELDLSLHHVGAC